MHEIVKVKLSNGNIVSYRMVHNTAYHAETNETVINILERARLEHGRVRFCLGDTKTGRDWGDTSDCCGYIGRSTGQIKVPLLIKYSTSMGGPSLLDHCIIRLEYKEKRKGKYIEVYRHKNYHKGELQ